MFPNEVEKDNQDWYYKTMNDEFPLKLFLLFASAIMGLGISAHFNLSGPKELIPPFICMMPVIILIIMNTLNEIY